MWHSQIMSDKSPPLNNWSRLFKEIVLCKHTLYGKNVFSSIFSIFCSPVPFLIFWKSRKKKSKYSCYYFVAKVVWYVLLYIVCMQIFFPPNNMLLLPSTYHLLFEIMHTRNSHNSSAAYKLHIYYLANIHKVRWNPNYLGTTYMILIPIAPALPEMYDFTPLLRWNR